MTETGKNNEMPEIVLIREEDMMVCPVTGVFGSLRPEGAQVTLFHDTVIPRVLPDGQMIPGTIERHLVLETHLSPQRFISIAKWMMAKVEDLEQFMEDQKETIKDQKTED